MPLPSVNVAATERMIGKASKKSFNLKSGIDNLSKVVAHPSSVDRPRTNPWT